VRKAGPITECKIARGVADRKCLKRVVCAFDDETFDQVRARAVRDQTSFAEQVRQLVEWGLEADKRDV
jgi:hypothetical protein